MIIQQLTLCFLILFLILIVWLNYEGRPNENITNTIIESIIHYHHSRPPKQQQQVYMQTNLHQQQQQQQSETTITNTGTKITTIRSRNQSNNSNNTNIDTLLSSSTTTTTKIRRKLSGLEQQQQQQQQHPPAVKLNNNNHHDQNSGYSNTNNNLPFSSSTTTTTLKKYINDHTGSAIASSSSSIISSSSSSSRSSSTTSSSSSSSSLLLQTFIDLPPSIGRYNVSIPTQFSTNDYNEFISLNNPKRYSFPRWDTTQPTTSTIISSNEEVNRISIIESILDFIQQQNQFYNNYKIHNYQEIYGSVNSVPWIHTIGDHTQESGTINWWFPETLYIVTSDTVLVSNTAKTITQFRNTDMIRTKINPTEINITKKAFNYLYNLYHSNNDNNNKDKEINNNWPRLTKLLFIDNMTLPYLAHYSDYKGCNYNNWKTSTGNNIGSIPLFTVAANVNCNNTFPMPNYRTARYHSKVNTTMWFRPIYKSMYRTMGYSNKYNQVLWRGSLTGQFTSSNKPPRYNLLKLIHSQSSSLTNEERSLFDVQLSGYPTGTTATFVSNDEVDNELGGVNRTKMKMLNFQLYKAILDIDGHSWSSRFGDLLCYHSVILKVEPQYVDYYYYPKNTTERIEAWKHYIPIKYDLSDLVEKTKYVMNPDNDEHIAEIITNSNDWCENRFIDHNIIIKDLLDIWESYIQVLDNDDPHWSSKWNELYKTIMANPKNHPQDMVPII